VQQASNLAESEGHHPDICFGWGYATVSLYTHKIKGLHEKFDEVADSAMKAQAD
jgi:4a-hydroxytetrahydrobiopterin dehydratase